MAQSGAVENRVSVPAAADIKKVCGDIKPGGIRIATCLKEHVADLSDACKCKLADVAAARKTCSADIEKHNAVPKVAHPESDLHQDALANLGDDCKAAIAAVVTSKK